MDRILNFESLLLRLGDDVELINELLNLFMDTIPEQMDILKSAVEKKDSKLVQQTAHSLKGSAGNISADKLAKTAAILEIAGKDGNTMDSASLFSVLLGEYKELEIIIRQSLNNL